MDGNLRLSQNLEPSQVQRFCPGKLKGGASGCILLPISPKKKYRTAVAYLVLFLATNYRQNIIRRDLILVHNLLLTDDHRGGFKFWLQIPYARYCSLSYWYISLRGPGLRIWLRYSSGSHQGKMGLRYRRSLRVGHRPGRTA